MDEEKRKHLQRGSVYRIAKLQAAANGKEMSKEIITSLSAYLEKQIAVLMKASCDKCEAAGKKQVKLQHLKDGAETLGILIE